jgi:putative chitobiose transport system permease protein
MLNTTPEAQSLKRKRQFQKRLENFGVYTILILVGILSIYPFLWTLRTSLSTTGGIFEFPPSLIPNEASLKNFITVTEIVPILRQALNSLIICFFGVVGAIFVAALGAYPLAKMKFWGRDIVFYALIATLVLPNEAGLIVNFITVSRLGLLATDVGQFAAVILPAFGSVANVFLMRQAYLGIPAELLEAARIDGASELRIWWSIMLPLTMPTIAAVSILQFVAFWNSFLWAFIVMRDRNLYPLSAGMLDLSGAFATNTRAISAGAVLMMIPILLVFMFFQRYFMRGLEGAVKG